MPLIPFAMLPVAALLAGGSRLSSAATIAALVLALLGGVLMLLFQGADARIPQDVAEPLLEGVWPLWSGQAPLPGWRYGERFCCNLISMAAPRWLARLDSRWQAVQFLPLVAFQLLGIGWLWWLGRRGAADSQRILSCVAMPIAPDRECAALARNCRGQPVRLGGLG